MQYSNFAHVKFAEFTKFKTVDENIANDTLLIGLLKSKIIIRLTERHKFSPQAFDDVSAEQRASQTLDQIQHGQDRSIHIKTPLSCGARTRNAFTSSSE